jgi:single-stranded-DNA-specific exonuclease
MDAMKNKPRVWLKSFLRKGLIPRKGIDEYALNFIIIPRINAAGRVSDPKISLDFLICEDEGNTDKFLNELHEANSKRQKVGNEILKEIVAKIDKNSLIEQNSLVLFKEDWHIGVIGIVAQKLVEMFGKPAIVITEVDGICKGSGRGGDGLNLHEILSSLSPLLLKYGGHKYACGISLSKDNLIVFREAFERSVHSVINIGQREVFADARANFEDLTEELMGFIESLSPFGVGNTRPCFLLSPLSVATIKNGRIKITDRSRRTWYGYNQTQTAVPQSENVSIIASPALREDMGEKFIHLNVKGFAGKEP